MDVISLHQAGFNNVVAPLGTSFTSEQANLLARYTKEIVLMLDADAAGKKALMRASGILENTGLKVRVVVIPDGKDPDEYIKKNGADRFRALLSGAVSDIEYKLLMAADGIEVHSDDGRLTYLGLAAGIIAEEDDIMTRDVYIGRLSDKYGVSRTALSAKVDELRKKNRRQKQKKEINEIISPKFTAGDINPDKRRSPKAAAAEETLIAVLLRHPDFYTLAKDELPREKMVTALNRRIYGIILDTLDSGGHLDISVFAQKLIPAEIGYLVRLQNSEKAGNNAKTVLKDCIKVILEEEMLLNSKSYAETSNDDWADNLKNMIARKNKEN